MAHWIGKEFYHYSIIDSTNSEAKRRVEEWGNGAVVLADGQTGGRGRRGKVWLSPPGTTISVSILCKPGFAAQKASMVTILTGLSVAQTIEKVTGLSAEIKWPNDVVIHGKKICGILTEMVMQENGQPVIIPGVGINVNNTTFAPEIQDMATSLILETGKSWDRMEIVRTLLNIFEEHYERFEQTEDLSCVKEEYENRLANRDREVRVMDPKAPYEGIARGIDSGGNLLVETEKGIRKVYAGEVSVRGLYGYV